MLDEPTNDLDSETLELLEERLVAYEGTVLLVSHDRAFLNNVVTSTLVFEGDELREYVGGYDDWVRQRRGGARAGRPARRRAPTNRSPPRRRLPSPESRRSFPSRSSASSTSCPPSSSDSKPKSPPSTRRWRRAEFYKQPADAIAAKAKRLEACETQLAAAMPGGKSWKPRASSLAL